MEDQFVYLPGAGAYINLDKLMTVVDKGPHVEIYYVDGEHRDIVSGEDAQVIIDVLEDMTVNIES